MRDMIRWFVLGCLIVAASSGLAAEGKNPVTAAHAGDLVVLKNGKLVPFQSTRFFEAPYTILYFGAGWCPDCRKFSPGLVSAYDEQPAGAKRFEVLLYPMDKSADEQLKFMQSEKMKWPAVAFEKLASASDLKKFYSEKGIPWLAVLDREGHLVLQSKSDQDAAEVLKEVEHLVKAKR